jgi:hypothetical protein
MPWALPKQGYPQPLVSVPSQNDRCWVIPFGINPRLGHISPRERRTLENWRICSQSYLGGWENTLVSKRFNGLVSSKIYRKAPY